MSIWHDVKKEGLDNLAPKTALIVGLVGGIMAICTLGFFILLGFMFKGNIDFSLAKGNKPAPAVIDPTAPTNPGSGPISLAPVTDRDHVLGAADAELTLVEYSDYECPFCKSFHPTVKRVLQEYEGRLKIVYRHFPLSFHANAQKQAEASECVAELAGNEAFWEFTDAIFERTTSGGTGFALADLPKLAVEVGANEAKFTECLDSGKYNQYVLDDMQSGVAAGVQGTPGSIIVDQDGNTRAVEGAVPYETLKADIEAMLNS